MLSAPVTRRPRRAACDSRGLFLDHYTQARGLDHIHLERAPDGLIAAWDRACLRLDQALHAGALVPEALPAFYQLLDAHTHPRLV